MVKIADIAKQNGFDATEFTAWVQMKNIPKNIRVIVEEKLKGEKQ